MNILVICQHYFPEPFRITDICEELVCQGHSVTVVTGTPNYPMGKIYPGYCDGKCADEVRNGVRIHRCKTAPRKTGAVNRIINYFSYASQSKKYVKTLADEFDVVFVNQLSPVMMAEAGVTYKKRFKKKLVIYCLDLWPDSLCVGGIKKDSLIYQIFRWISRRIYRAADELLITSASFREHLKEQFHISDERIANLPQYAESQFLELQSKTQEEEFQLVFAGNIGKAQSISTIVDAARCLKNESVCFHIIGDGSELESLMTRACDLPQVIFHGRKPLEEMPRYYEQADAMLVTLTADPVISLTLPGKVQTYMAAGKPIIGAVNGETALVLKDAQGDYYGPAENAEILAQNIKKLMESGNVREIGQRNREYYLKNFQKEKFIEQLVAHLS